MQTDMLPVTRKLRFRSKLQGLTGVCNSHYVSNFAAFFIFLGANTSVAESVCYALFILQNMLCLFCVRENARRRKHTQVQFCGCFGWFKARNRLQKCLEKFSLDRKSVV